MNNKIKSRLFAIVCLAAVVFVTACGVEPTPYETNNNDKYTVSVKYDANGGIFTTNTSVIVDSYNISDMEKNSGNMAEIALLSPDDNARGNDAFKAVNNGYFLAGWYAGRTETTDSEGKASYVYSDKWDFATDLLKIDASKEYSSETPVLTLYAAWVPLFKIEFFSLGTGEHLKSFSYDPTLTELISVPKWNESTGTIDMYDFPEKNGYTFNKAYYDIDGNNAVDSEKIIHPGKVNYEKGVAKDSVLNLYVDWTEGEWYRIYNAEQLAKNASLNGNYEILADLDFSEAVWPTAFMYGNFNGTIKGNGHTIKNVTIVQTNNSKVNAGLFGYLTEKSSITDVSFENVSFTVKAGTRVMGTNYGILAGTISKDAGLENLKICMSKLQIDSDCYFGVDDYSIGVVCGMGNFSAVETSDIEVLAVGNDPDKFSITVDGNTVTVSEAAE